MSMDWFCWHHGTVNDPKWRVIARKANARVADVLAVFAAFLERASQADPRGAIAGWDADTIAAGLNMDPDQVTAIHAAMQGRILDGDSLTGWSKRQPKRERPDDAPSSTERTRKHREQRRSLSEDCAAAADSLDPKGTDAGPPRNATEHQGTPREDKMRLDPKEAAADAGEPNAIRLALDSIGAWDHPGCRLNGARVLEWLRQGAELERDILPTLKAVIDRARAREGPAWLPHSLSYFDKAVIDAVTQRTKPMPAPEISHGNRTANRPRQPSYAERIAANRAATIAVLAPELAAMAAGSGRTDTGGAGDGLSTSQS
jgi:hypothetical protein